MSASLSFQKNQINLVGTEVVSAGRVPCRSRPPDGKGLSCAPYLYGEAMGHGGEREDEHGNFDRLKNL